MLDLLRRILSPLVAAGLLAMPVHALAAIQRTFEASSENDAHQCTIAAP